jgi:hypothetical protein
MSRGLPRDGVLVSVTVIRTLSGGHAVARSEQTKAGLRDKLRR